MDRRKNFEKSLRVVEKRTYMGRHVARGRYNQLNRILRRLELREEFDKRSGRQLVADLVRQEPPDSMTCLHCQHCSLDIIKDNPGNKPHDLLATIAPEPPLHWM
jgi:hypothetical protein